MNYIFKKSVSGICLSLTTATLGLAAEQSHFGETSTTLSITDNNAILEKVAESVLNAKGASTSLSSMELPELIDIAQPLLNLADYGWQKKEICEILLSIEFQEDRKTFVDLLVPMVGKLDIISRFSPLRSFIKIPTEQRQSYLALISPYINNYDDGAYLYHTIREFKQFLDKIPVDDQREIVEKLSKIVQGYNGHHRMWFLRDVKDYPLEILNKVLALFLREKIENESNFNNIFKTFLDRFIFVMDADKEIRDSIINKWESRFIDSGYANNDITRVILASYEKWGLDKDNPFVKAAFEHMAEYNKTQEEKEKRREETEKLKKQENASKISYKTIFQHEITKINNEINSEIYSEEKISSFIYKCKCCLSLGGNGYPNAMIPEIIIKNYKQWGLDEKDPIVIAAYQYIQSLLNLNSM